MSTETQVKTPRPKYEIMVGRKVNVSDVFPNIPSVKAYVEATVKLRKGQTARWMKNPKQGNSLLYVIFNSNGNFSREVKVHYCPISK